MFTGLMTAIVNRGDWVVNKAEQVITIEDESTVSDSMK
jgi:hypothetical protein